MLLYLLSKMVFLTSRRGRAAEIKMLGMKLLYFRESPVFSNPNGRLLAGIRLPELKTSRLRESFPANCDVPARRVGDCGSVNSSNLGAASDVLHGLWRTGKDI